MTCNLCKYFYNVEILTNNIILYTIFLQYVILKKIMTCVRNLRHINMAYNTFVLIFKQ